MFVQPKDYENEFVDEPHAKRSKKETSVLLKECCLGLTNVQQYRCPPGGQSEPPARAFVNPPMFGTTLQQARSVIHSLSRSDNKGRCPSPSEQMVPAYSGAQACRYPPTIISKPYYHTTYNEPPNKSVVNDIMVRQVHAMEQKNIPFTFLVGDLPTYKMIVQLKSENPNLFTNITPILGAFHQQMSYIHAIYKRFKGSGMSDTLVAAGVVVEGSVEQALQGKHYRKGSTVHYAVERSFDKPTYSNIA